MPGLAIEFFCVSGDMDVNDNCRTCAGNSVVVSAEVLFQHPHEIVLRKGGLTVFGSVAVSSHEVKFNNRWNVNHT
jgi:hypothetical protein